MMESNPSFPCILKRKAAMGWKPLEGSEGIRSGAAMPNKGNFIKHRRYAAVTGLKGALASMGKRNLGGTAYRTDHAPKAK